MLKCEICGSTAIQDETISEVIHVNINWWRIFRHLSVHNVTRELLAVKPLNILES